MKKNSSVCEFSRELQILISKFLLFFSYYVAAGRTVSMSEVKEEVAKVYKKQLDAQAKELFLPFRCFCTKKAVSL